MNAKIFQLAIDAEEVAKEITKTPWSVNDDKGQASVRRSLVGKLNQFSIEIRALAAGLE
jgi:hypothetical protein